MWNRCTNRKQRHFALVHVNHQDREINCNSSLQQTASMDYKNSESNEEKSELKDLLGVLLLQTQLSTPEKVETDNDPWWLQKENHLANLELDYTEQKGDIKPLTPGKETAAEKNIRNKNCNFLI